MHSHLGAAGLVLAGLAGPPVLHTWHTQVYADAEWFAGRHPELGIAAVSEFQASHRSIDIEQPRFMVGLVAAAGRPQVKVTVAGKIPPSHALVTVTPFQQAAIEIQAGAVANEIGLGYGLSAVLGRLLELYFDRP